MTVQAPNLRLNHFLPGPFEFGEAQEEARGIFNDNWLSPSVPSLWSLAIQTEMPPWFEAHSLTDPDIQQERQVDAIRASIRYLLDNAEQDAEDTLSKFSHQLYGRCRGCYSLAAIHR